MRYKHFWTDFHSNPHHENLSQLEDWVEHARQLMDFWPVAYYPYYLRKLDSGLAVEDIYESTRIAQDWRLLSDYFMNHTSQGFPLFLGYEWQGSGQDGDHNVFFRDFGLDPFFPLRYKDLANHFKDTEAIGIPHHLAYSLGHRGKNWETQDDRFSPVAEVYSSHGSSEQDDGSIPMDRHIHMGPRSESNSISRGLKQGHRVGLLSGGDNHSVPGVFGFGLTAVLAEDNSRDALFEALRRRRVYGVSHNRIKLEMTMDGQPMGSVLPVLPQSRLEIGIEAGSAIDRIEILKNETLLEMIPQDPVAIPKEGLVRFKFKLDFGWGPDRRIFPDIEKRLWKACFRTEGRLLSVEKCWSNFGQEILALDDHSVSFKLTTFKTTATGKWMGPSAVTPEGLILEVEADVKSDLDLETEEMHIRVPVRELLEGSRVIPLMDEARALLKSRFGFEDYYRSDPWWHNAYKIKWSKASLSEAYCNQLTRVIHPSAGDTVRIRVWQKDGSCAWSSPFFFGYADSEVG